MQTERDLAEATEQALQRIRNENSILSDYLSRTLGMRGWQVEQLRDILYEHIASYRMNGYISYLFVRSNDSSIEVEGKVTKKNVELVDEKPQISVPTIYNSTKVCDDLTSAQQHILSEGKRLEDMANESHEKTTESSMSLVA